MRDDKNVILRIVVKCNFRLNEKNGLPNYHFLL